MKNPIKAFCTVNTEKITHDGESYFCDQCQCKLLDVDNKQKISSKFKRTSGIVCGIATAITLSSCGNNIDDIPIPGIYYSEEDLNSKGGLYPEAKYIDKEKNTVISPFGGHTIDVGRIPMGSLVIDPLYSVEELKIFRI